jgi:uncharacterized membrane protein YkoI
MKRKTHIATLVALSVCGAIGGSYGAMAKGNDALSITASKISLIQAISSAEKYVGGVASRAEYEQEKGQDVFEVEVVKGTSVMDVLVNARNGNVIAAHEDTNDRANERDEDED